MLILSDFECPSGHVTEELCHWKQKKLVCKCGKTAKRIISTGRTYLGNEDAPWLRSVLDVVDKENPAPHVQEFLKHPTRSNYKAWMKGEGIRPLDHTEHGGPPVARKPEGPDVRQLTEQLWRRHRDRKRIEVRR